MTGLLSVFSLFPVQPLQMKEDGREKVEDEEDGVESTDKDNER